MKVAILGSGDVAKALGKGFLDLGHEVKFGTRKSTDPYFRQWVDEQGEKASVGTFADAARFGDLAVLAVRGTACEEALKLADPKNLSGKVLIDATNPLVFKENAPPDLAWGHHDSGGEHVQRAVPRSHVVKAFNTIGNSSFYRPTFPGGPPDMFVCGNDANAKEKVAEILRAFGWPSTIDLGGIEGARILEVMCLAWVRSAMSLNNFNIGFKVLRR
jgi:8-hydroxy-5-deazaflavin:NADPH oxidoreductase